MKKFVFALLLSLCLGIAPVFACSIPTENPNMTATPMPTVEDYTQMASVIFVGRATQELISSSYWSRSYEIRVEHYLKGDGYNIVLLEGYYDFCGYGLSIDRDYIFFVQPYDNSQNIPTYSYIDLSLIDEEARITAITGQSIPAQPLPLDIQLTRIAENGDLNWLYIPVSIAIALIGAVVLVVSLRLSKRHKSKAKREELL